MNFAVAVVHGSDHRPHLLDLGLLLQERHGLRRPERTCRFQSRDPSVQRMSRPQQRFAWYTSGPRTVPEKRLLDVACGKGASHRRRLRMRIAISLI